MASNKKHVVIVGATSAIAEHCARLLVKDAVIEMTLVGRNLHKTERTAADLRVRSPHSLIRVLEANFIDPLVIGQLVDVIVAYGAVHTVLIAHGSLPDQAICQKDLAACYDTLLINGVSSVLFAEAFAGHMEKAGHGTLAIIGSVAGDRGRKSNYVYGAAKGLVARYAQGLQHRLAGTGVKVVLIKPGPTDTPMTAQLKKRGIHLANIDDVSQLIVKAISEGKLLVYAPRKWALIMMILRHLPSFIFRRIDV